jgi:hypothetical protein
MSLVNNSLIQDFQKQKCLLMLQSQFKNHMLENYAY